MARFRTLVACGAATALIVAPTASPSAALAGSLRTSGTRSSDCAQGRLSSIEREIDETYRAALPGLESQGFLPAGVHNFISPTVALSGGVLGFDVNEQFISVGIRNPSGYRGTVTFQIDNQRENLANVRTSLVETGTLARGGVECDVDYTVRAGLIFEPSSLAVVAAVLVAVVTAAVAAGLGLTDVRYGIKSAISKMTDRIRKQKPYDYERRGI